MSDWGLIPFLIVVPRWRCMWRQPSCIVLLQFTVLETTIKFQLNVISHSINAQCTSVQYTILRLSVIIFIWEIGHFLSSNECIMRTQNQSDDFRYLQNCFLKFLNHFRENDQNILQWNQCAANKTCHTKPKMNFVCSWMRGDKVSEIPHVRSRTNGDVLSVVSNSTLMHTNKVSFISMCVATKESRCFSTGINFI